MLFNLEQGKIQQIYIELHAKYLKNIPYDAVAKIVFLKTLSSIYN